MSLVTKSTDTLEKKREIQTPKIWKKNPKTYDTVNPERLIFFLDMKE